jgi:peptide/nickel transport system ATP-binding protein
MSEVLSVRGLKVEFPTEDGLVQAVNDVSFSVRRGEVLGIVGESGSGKSVTGFAIMRQLQAPGRIAAGEIRFEGQDLTQLSDEEMRRLRGNRIAMIFQDPTMTLNPVLRVGTQMTETIQAHRSISRTKARALARDALGQVGIPSPDERLDAYPHEFSGGMRQRVSIAIALLNEPQLIIADEPTTALDVTIQSQIISVVQNLVRENGMGLIWVTHDLSVVSRLADTVAVMYASQIMEYGPTDEVIYGSKHPYTAGLIGSLPSENRHGKRLQQIPGSTPSAFALPAGCLFQPRCARRSEICLNRPNLDGTEEHIFRCHHPLTSRHEAQP